MEILPGCAGTVVLFVKLPWYESGQHRTWDAWERTEQILN